MGLMPKSSEVTKGFPRVIPLASTTESKVFDAVPVCFDIFFPLSILQQLWFLPFLFSFHRNKVIFFFNSLHYSGLLFFIITPAVPQHFCSSIPWITARASNLILLRFAGRYVLFLTPVLDFSTVAGLHLAA